ncbi:complement C3 [Lepisosteus oculatus]|uniref:complement C3 n=1 Tax=Lepisosteus oculatus TaxID=7918 RepID=UPI0035F5061A
MNVFVVCLTVLSLSYPTTVSCQPLYVLTAPNVLRVESEENILLQAHDYVGGDLNVDILVFDFPGKKQQLYVGSVILKPDQYQATHKIKIPEGSFNKESKLNQYVYLQAKFGGHVVESAVLVSFQSGYIFVQTDKSIYTPTDTVLYRVFALTNRLDPSKSSVSVEIMTPDGIVIQKDLLFSANGIISGSYKLPEILSTGTWKVVTKFESTPQKNFTADFEVKEYVLPNFEVKLEPHQLFFYIDDEELTVSVTARYLYGKDVVGSAYVVFGVVLDNDEKRSFPDSLQRIEITAGKGTATLKRQHILKIYKEMKEILKKSIYVSATVLTSTGSDIVEAERRGIQIVQSPYAIHFTKTPKYFKPGMPFDVMVLVTNPDGTPASNIDVEISPEISGRTQQQGTTKMTVNTRGDATRLPITVKTKAPNLTPDRQATGSMEALPYRTQLNSKNYLHIGIQAAELEPGTNLQVNLNLGNDAGVQDQIKYFSYQIVNKGQIMTAGKQARLPGQSLVTLSLRIEKEMIPSFRFVAYYYLRKGGQIEVVADSVWVDVKDTCMGTLRVTPTTDRDRRVYEPRRPFSLTLIGDPGAKVGLVAVDKGVYVLNNKNRLSQSKIWDIVEKNDIGCTAGSGSDNMNVFNDAGLMFKSSSGSETKPRTDPTCPEPPKRRRRSLVLGDIITSLGNNFSGPLQKCCRDGMAENIMDYTCEKRTQFIIEGKECIDAFLHCCKEIAKRHKERQREMLALARSEEDDDYISDDEIVSRTEFPESWLWQIETLPTAPKDKDGLVKKDIQSFLKDSITTWEITAISLSPLKGICVADVYEITVLKNFFIDLKLPYSVVRNEQVEIKAVVYNYEDMPIKVRVELMENEQVCSAASQKRKYRVEVNIDPLSSRAVPFVIIPMEKGELEIEVKASVFGVAVYDGVKKKLRVVAEGVQTKKTIKTIELNPSVHGGVQSEKVDKIVLPSLVPKTEPQTFISVTGEILTETIESAISGEPLGSLITQPSGCGEQNMIYMTSPVIATHYLDSTQQWEKVGLERRAEAINYINKGYTQQLAYRHPDDSYAAWLSRPSSTWLTAYVAKIFGLAYSLISVDDRVLCGAIKWLILNKQQPDGIFKEDAPVIHGEMVGDVRGKDADASLTAFVVIAMQESREICGQQIQSMEGSINKAVQFLQRRIRSLTNPYAVAMTSYALALNKQNTIETLMKFASADKSHWPVPGSHLFSLEASSYALLALLKYKEFDQAGAIVRWLTEQRFYGGGYGSTQATIMVFQAVAEYRIQVPLFKDIDLDVEISLAGRSKPTKWKIVNSNAYVAKSERARLDQNFTLVARGKGQGTMSVMTLYNALPDEKKTPCKTFDLDVKIERAPNARRPEGALDTFKLTIEITYQKDTDATMSILDVTMLTGFIPDFEDLRKLSNGVDQYIQKFEMDKALSEKGSLIIYLDKVSHKLADRIAFKVHKMYQVGLIQPAAVAVYEYYANENRCVKFYHPEKETGTLSRICQGDVCRCAEESCSKQKSSKDELDIPVRLTAACDPGVDYVYKVKLVEFVQSSDKYIMLIEDVIKEGSDTGVREKMRSFVSHSTCRETLGFEKNRSYLIMGKSVDLINTNEGFVYFIGSGTWIELWPTDVECQSLIFQTKCEQIKEVASELLNFGCPN